MNEREKRRNFICQMIKKHGWKVGAEIGVLVGWTHFYLLENCPELKTFAIDNWPRSSGSDNYPNQDENRAEFYEIAAGFGDRCQIIEKDSVSAAKDIPDGSLDFVFIDADHTYEGCRADILAWAPKLKETGWLLGHDYHRYPGVQKAVDEWLGFASCDVEYSDDIWAKQKVPTGKGTVTICCLKAGSKYGADYVNKLYNMVQRNIRFAGADFMCYTDDPQGIEAPIRTMPLPLPLDKFPGWWQKLAFYQGKLEGVYTNKILFLDLDMVITGCMDSMLEMDSSFATSKDWPTGRWPVEDRRDRFGNTSAVLLEVGSRTDIWEQFIAAPNEIMQKWPGDQEWINDTFFASMDLMPETFVQSYKLHKLAGPTIPNCAAVMFHGVPKPSDCEDWVKEVWK